MHSTIALIRVDVNSAYWCIPERCGHQPSCNSRRLSHRASMQTLMKTPVQAPATAILAVDVTGIPESVVQSQNAALTFSVIANVALAFAIFYLWIQNNKNQDRQLETLIKSATTTEKTIYLLDNVVKTNESLVREIDELQKGVIEVVRDVREIVGQIRGNK